MPEPAPGAGLGLAVQLVAELAADQLAAVAAVDLSAAVPSAVQPKPRKSKGELHSLQNSAGYSQKSKPKPGNQNPFNSKHILNMCVQRQHASLPSL